MSNFQIGAFQNLGGVTLILEDTDYRPMMREVRRFVAYNQIEQAAEPDLYVKNEVKALFETWEVNYGELPEDWKEETLTNLTPAKGFLLDG